MDKRICLICSEPLVGRIDKKFCTPDCRSIFHNQRKTPHEQFISKTNKVLRSNRSILNFFNPKGHTVVRYELLYERGFNFNLFSGIYRSQNGKIYYLCYDMAYSYLPEQKIRIVNYQPYMETVFKEQKALFFKS